MIGLMNIKESKNYKDYQFVCWYWEQGNAWGHEARLCKYGTEVGKGRTRYYNRTWEAYTYQSVMRMALDDYKKQELERYIENYKYENNLKGWNRETSENYEKPLPKGKRKELTEEFNNQPIWKELEDFVREGK